MFGILYYYLYKLKGISVNCSYDTSSQEYYKFDICLIFTSTLIFLVGFSSQIHMSFICTKRHRIRERQ